MKIAFPLLNEKELAKDFTQAKHIGIYDEEEDHTEMISITEIEKQSTVALFFETMISLGLNAIVSPHFSNMSLRVFKENQIETLKTSGFILTQNIFLYKEKELNPFNVYESLINDGCIRDCGSCGTTCSSN